MNRNILANYVGSGVLALAPLLALPWYLSALGPQRFGLVGFVVMLQALLALVDSGMSQALVRELALRFQAGSAARQQAADLMLSFERIYLGFAVVAAMVMAMLSKPIAVHWLALGEISVSDGVDAVYGAALIFAFQFPGSLYRSLLVGAQAQVGLNIVMVGGAVMRHLGGALLVMAWPSLTTYLMWHAGTALLETLVRAVLAWHTVEVRRRDSRWDGVQLRLVGRMVAGMSLASFLGALTVQIDRLIVSKLVPIEQFGYYTIAVAVSAGALQLIYPLVQAALPKAIALKDQPEQLYRFSLKLVIYIGAIVSAGALIFVALGHWLLTLWLKDLEVAQLIFSLLSFLLIGTALNAFYNVGYVHWLIHQRFGKILGVNLVSLVLSIFLIPPLVDAHGIVGAAFGWVAINLVGFSFSLGWSKKSNNA